MSYTNTEPISVMTIVVMDLPLNLNKTAAKILKVRVVRVDSEYIITLSPLSQMRSVALA